MFLISSMGIFSQTPKSFNLDRDSPFAADLKSTISVQLPLSLGPLFDDDILAEYITVLVCNGKTQIQARDDLDAFLGERSEAFDTDDIMACTEESGRSRRNTSEVKNEKAGDAATIEQMLDHQKTQNNVLPKVFTSSAKRGLLSGATSPVPDWSHNRQVSGPPRNYLSPTNLGSLYCDKVSVWDRLSQPSKAALFDAHGDNARKFREGPNDICPPFLLTTRSPMRCVEAIHVCNRYQGRASKHNGTNNFNNNLSGDRYLNDIRRKRNFVQISQSDSRLLGRRCWDNIHNNQWRADKRSKFVAKASRDLLSTVEDVKLRLSQMEREISLLRSRNEGTGKNQNHNSSMKFGAKELTAEDHESRTVLVSNVHYAAKRDALFVYFAKCGRVINVVLLSDFLSFAPDRSAYVTFASLESVDRAVSLSGTIFYSRALKITKYNRKLTLPAVSTSPAVSYTGRLVQHSASSYHGTRLLCRQESAPCPVTEGEVAELTASGPEQPSLSSSPMRESVMEKTDEGGDQLPSAVSPTKDIAGYADIHNAEKVNMEVELSASGDEQSSLSSPVKEFVAEETNVEVQVQVSACGDEQPSLIPSPLKDLAGYSNMQNAEWTAEKTNTEAEVKASEIEQPSLISAVEDGSEKTNMEADNKACEDEQPVLVSVVEDDSGPFNIHNPEQSIIAEETDNVTSCVDCLPEELHC
ncbi:LOW QUALITY PROTEIN: hypothetical protein V2J09_011381 [Rumex salicifolius]